MDFCDICKNKIDLSIDINRNLIVKCNSCDDRIQDEPEKSNSIVVDKKNNKPIKKDVIIADKEHHILSKYDAEIEKDITKRVLRNMEHDITNNKVEKKCVNCNHKIMKMRRFGDNLRRVYGCENCGTKFTD